VAGVRQNFHISEKTAGHPLKVYLKIKIDEDIETVKYGGITLYSQ